MTDWWGAEPTIVVVGDGLTATVVPGRGGKIVSLVDAAGIEWLAQAATEPPAPARSGDAFIAAEMAGWDECAPSIDACIVDGVAIADHGDLWTAQWTATNDGALRASGASLPYSLERLIRPSPGGLRLEYRAESLGGDVPLLWAAHPQFRAPAGSTVSLPSVERVVDVLDSRAPHLRWMPDLAVIDTVAPGGSRKLYVEPASAVTEALLTRPDAGTLTMRWSDTCRYLGVWFDRQRYSREPVIALEPSTGYFDSLATAIANGRVTTLLPGRPLEWSIELRVDPR